MRPREWLVILGSGVTLGGVLFGATPWVRYGAPLALLLTGWHLWRDGARRAMSPAYILVGLALYGWADTVMAPPAHAIPIPLAMIILIGILAAIGLPLLFPIAPLPEPSGPFAIGTLTYHWVDTARADIFRDPPGGCRELMVQIWYPAVLLPHAPRAPYLPDAQILTATFARLHRRPAGLLRHLRAVTSHAVAAAPPLASSHPYPVLLFLEGATGFRQMNTIQVESLVSHGFVVVGLDQPYTAAAVVFPDGRQVTGLAGDQLHALVRPSYLATDPPATLHGQVLPDRSIIPYLAQDVSLVLDRLHNINQADPHGPLTGYLDLTRVGAFGVSLGGIVVTEACLRDPRIRAGLSMDAPVSITVTQASLRTPMLWISRDRATMRLERQRAGGWSEEEIEAHQTSMRQAFDHCATTAAIVRLPGLFHVNLTDIPSWSPLITALGIAGPIGARRGWRIINAVTLAFFQQHLHAHPTASLTQVARRYPEIVMSTHYGDKAIVEKASSTSMEPSASSFRPT